MRFASLSGQRINPAEVVSFHQLASGLTYIRFRTDETEVEESVEVVEAALWRARDDIPPTASCRDCRWHFKDDDSRLRCSSHLGHDYDGTTIGAKIPVWVEPIGCEKWREKP